MNPDRELLPHRHHAVLALLLERHLTDTLPAATIPRWQTEIERGFTDRDWHECPTCHGAGELNTRKGTARCTAAKCKGKGGWHGDNYDQEARTIILETASILEPNEYTNRLLDYLTTPGAAAWKLCRDTHQRSRHAIPDPDDLANQLRARAGTIAQAQADDDPRNAWRTQLDQALELLTTVDVFAALAVKRQHILHDLPWDSDSRDDYRRALTHIGRLLAQTFRAPRWAREQAAERSAA